MLVVSMETCPSGKVIARFPFILGLGVKEHFQIVTQHNRLRSRVSPMAANMQKMVGSFASRTQNLNCV